VKKAHCCGSVLTLIKEPTVAANVGKVRLDEAKEAGANKVIALCPVVNFQLRVTANKKNLPVELLIWPVSLLLIWCFDFPKS